MLQVETATEHGEEQVVLRGKVTLIDTPELRHRILEIIDGARGRISVDLSEVVFLDSSGVAILVEAWRRAHDGGKAFVLVDPSATVMRVLELTQLDRVFDIRRNP